MASFENPVPIRDGQRLTYHPRTSAAFCLGDLLLYVNGMLTSGTVHRDTAEVIADGVGLPVDGIYNLSGSTALQTRAQLHQALEVTCDRLRSEGLLERAGCAVVTTVSSATIRPRGWEYSVQDFIQSAGDWSSQPIRLQHAAGNRGPGVRVPVRTAALPPRTREDRDRAARAVLRRNRAALSLYEAMLGALTSGRGARVVAHSQGCLIARNAVDALGWTMNRPLQEVVLYPLASPASWWPQGIKLRGPYTVKEDAVAMLGLFRSRTGSAQVTSIGGSVGIGAQHDVNTYFGVTRFFDDLRSDLGVGDVPHPNGTAPSIRSGNMSVGPMTGVTR